MCVQPILQQILSLHAINYSDIILTSLPQSYYFPKKYPGIIDRSLIVQKLTSYRIVQNFDKGKF